MCDKITFEEAAKTIGVTRVTIYNYIEKGLLTPLKNFNGRVYFDRSEVLELVKLPFTDKLPDADEKGVK